MNNMAYEAHDHHMPTSDPGGMKNAQMSFFWGIDVDVLFAGWPGYGRPGMYLLALLFVFVLTIAVEVVSAVRWLKSDRPVVQTMVYTVRVGLAYLVMLAVMSFNLGVLLAALAGHAAGFLIFRSRAFQPSSELQQEY